MARHIKRSAQSWTYMLVSDRELPPEQQTEFVMRPMTVDDYAAAQDDLVRTRVERDGTRTIINRTRQQGLAIALAHITDVRNFPVGAPQAWPEAIEKRRDFLAQLHADDVQELANEVFVRASLGDAEKNSLPPERISASGADSPANTSTTAPIAASSG